MSESFFWVNYTIAAVCIFILSYRWLYNHSEQKWNERHSGSMYGPKPWPGYQESDRFITALLCGWIAAFWGFFVPVVIICYVIYRVFNPILARLER